MESAESTEKYKEDFLYEGIYEKIDLAVISRLQGCEYYQKWQKKSNKITKSIHL